MNDKVKVFSVIEQGEEKLIHANDSGFAVRTHVRAMLWRLVHSASLERAHAKRQAEIERARRRLWCPEDRDKAREALEAGRTACRGLGRRAIFWAAYNYALASADATADPEYPGESQAWDDVAEEAAAAWMKLKKTGLE